jgi:hypothetical protein
VLDEVFGEERVDLVDAVLVEDDLQRGLDDGDVPPLCGVLRIAQLNLG